jgi:DNA-binding response OmpR family regulator
MASNRVLVVEDDPSVHGLIQAILEGESLEVVLAADGSLPFAVLVVTGAAEIAEPLRRELGPDGVLGTPFDVVTLADRVRALAERGPAAQGHGAHVAER